MKYTQGFSFGNRELIYFIPLSYMYLTPVTTSLWKPAVFRNIGVSWNKSKDVIIFIGGNWYET